MLFHKVCHLSFVTLSLFLTFEGDSGAAMPLFHLSILSISVSLLLYCLLNSAID